MPHDLKFFCTTSGRASNRCLNAYMLQDFCSEVSPWASPSPRPQKDGLQAPSSSTAKIRHRCYTNAQDDIIDQKAVKVQPSCCIPATDQHN
eukprot:1523927-Karenia_brevis.AAC.1